MAARARDLARHLDLLNRHVFFYDQWVPYAQRADFLLEADLLVYLHQPGLESTYAAVRSRFLDHLWVGCASLVSAGDAAAELVVRHRLGRVAPPGDAAAVALHVQELLLDPLLRQECAARARQLAADYTWEQVVAAVRRFCAAPRRSRETALDERLVGTTTPDTGKDTIAVQEDITMDAETQSEQSGQTEPAPMDQKTRNELLARLHTTWQVQPQPLASGIPALGRAKEFANSLTRWYVQSIVDQQNAFNAAMVNAVQAVAAQADQQNQELSSHVHFLHHQIQNVRMEIQAVIRRIERDERRIEQVAERLETMVEELQQHITQNQQHITQNHKDITENHESLLESQELIDQLRKRIEHNEYDQTLTSQRAARNKEMVEQLIHHLNDVENANTVLTGHLLQIQQRLIGRNGEQTE
jgi:hypothetical protein